MSRRYTKHFNTKETHQTEAIPGSNQVQNNAGGFVFELDAWGKLDRFLVLGTEGGTYYASENKLTRENASNVVYCITVDGVRTVNRIVEISEVGRAPKNDPAIFALAMAAKLGDPVTRKAALEALPRVCRIATHLFQFVEAMQGFGGWGRATKRAVAKWYTDKNEDQRAYQIVKYRNRGGWSHKDVLLLAHPGRVTSPSMAFAVGNPGFRDHVMPDVLHAFDLAQIADKQNSVPSMLHIIQTYPVLPWEAIPDQFQKSPDVWRALLPNMATTALMRNLARMTANGALQPMSDEQNMVIDHFRDADRIKKARVHPIAVLAALKTYAQGHGERGSLSWTPLPKIIDALNEAYYHAFGNVVPSGKRMLLGCDISGSMWSGTCAGIPGLTPGIGVAAMAMVTARTEKNYETIAFTSRIENMTITPNQRLDDIINNMQELARRMGTTDCAQPMIWALDRKIPVDLFVVYTDNETYAGSVHPKQALDKYRQKMGIGAKLAVVAMTPSKFSIADPKDAGMLDVVGFDTATPNLLSGFAVS